MYEWCDNSKAFISSLLNISKTKGLTELMQVPNGIKMPFRRASR